MKSSLAYARQKWKALATSFIILGVLTVFPWFASRPNHVSYYSICSFAPISTLMFFLLAAVFYSLGRGMIRWCYVGMMFLVVISGLSAYWAYSVKLPMTNLQVGVEIKSIAFYTSLLEPRNWSLIDFNWTFHNPAGQETAAFCIEDYDLFINGRKIISKISIFPGGSRYGKQYIFRPFTVKTNQTLTRDGHVMITRDSVKIEGGGSESLWNSLTQKDFNITLKGVLVSRTNFGIIDPSPVIIVARPLSISCSYES